VSIWFDVKTTLDSCWPEHWLKDATAVERRDSKGSVANRASQRRPDRLSSRPARFGLLDFDTGQLIAQADLGGSVIGFSPDGNMFLVGGRPFVVYSSRDGRIISRSNLQGGP